MEQVGYLGDKSLPKYNCAVIRRYAPTIRCHQAPGKSLSKSDLTVVGLPPIQVLQVAFLEHPQPNYYFRGGIHERPALALNAAPVLDAARQVTQVAQVLKGNIAVSILF